MRWIEQPVFFIDFEGSLASGILEYGVVTLLGGRIVETKTRLCRATGRVRPEDAAVHGLREDDVAAQAPLADTAAIIPTRKTKARRMGICFRRF